MHFSASEASEKVIMHLISSANDRCVLYGICDHLGKRNKDELESRQDSASIVHTPRVLSDDAWTAEETSQHERAIALLPVRER